MVSFKQIVVMVLLWMSDGVTSWLLMVISKQQHYHGSPLMSAVTSNSVSSSAATKTVCVIESETLPEVTAQLAERLSLPLLSQQDLQCVNHPSTMFWSHALSVEPYSFGGILEDYSIGISCFDQKSRGKKRRISMKPFSIDFCPPASSNLAKRSSGDAGPDLLNKAVSPRKGITKKGAVVYDLTAGLGQDSLLIALAGANRVHMVEREPIVATLLEDALRRLKLIAEQTLDLATSNAATILFNQMSLECGDGTSVMESLLRQSNSTILPDIIYLDPMFPARRKSSSVKKNMQILHGLLNSQGVTDEARQMEEEALLRLAYDATKSRVVVKRPANAPHLGCHDGKQLRPSYQISGSINRWDVYVK